MEEINIQIQKINIEMKFLECKMDSFWTCERTPSNDERLSALEMLNKWSKLEKAREILIDTLTAIKSNTKYETNI